MDYILLQQIGDGHSGQVHSAKKKIKFDEFDEFEEQQPRTGRVCGQNCWNYKLERRGHCEGAFDDDSSTRRTKWTRTCKYCLATGLSGTKRREWEALCLFCDQVWIWWRFIWTPFENVGSPDKTMDWAWDSICLWSNASIDWFFGEKRDLASRYQAGKLFVDQGRRGEKRKEEIQEKKKLSRWLSRSTQWPGQARRLFRSLSPPTLHRLRTICRNTPNESFTVPPQNDPSDHEFDQETELPVIKLIDFGSSNTFEVAVQDQDFEDLHLMLLPKNGSQMIINATKAQGMSGVLALSLPHAVQRRAFWRKAIDKAWFSIQSSRYERLEQTEKFVCWFVPSESLKRFNISQVFQHPWMVEISISCL